jgi:hypothetical protein
LKRLLQLFTSLIAVVPSLSGLSQTVSAVETYGPVPATQVYSGLGANITPTNAWEYAAAEAAHITWGRFDCSWDKVEIQNMPANTSGGYVLPSVCAAGLTNSKNYGVHPLVNALYGPPYSAVAVGTTTAAVAVGDTTVSILVSAGSLNSVVPGSTFLSIPSGYLSTKYSYPGVLVTGVSGSTVTLATAATTALPQGSTVTLNLLLYPPVIIASGSSFTSNPSVQAFGNYASFLAQQVAASGISGVVSIWNEPEWCCDKWDHGVDLYDTPPANSNISPTLGVELPLYVATMKGMAGVTFDNGYPEVAMWPASFFYPANFAFVQNLSNLQSVFSSESFHIYGNNPEDYIWNQTCVKANATTALLSNILAGACTPIGDWTANSDQAAVASQYFPTSAGGVKHIITEAGICRSCTGATETQISRFDLRLFLSMQALGISPVIFYEVSGDPDWAWFNSSQAPYPVYTAFQGLMADIGAIANPPVTACPACATPSVSSYTGYFPLATVAFVGARSGDSSNSILYYTWQRTYGTKWASVASPASVPVSVSIPAGMTVTSVKDPVTGAAVSFNVSGTTLSYQVADDPLEVLLTPTPATQTISFPAIASRVYGSAPFAVTATSSSGSAFPVTITVQSGPAVISGGTVSLTGVGTVVLKASQSGNTQVSAATATQTFQVTPAPLTATANNATRAYGAANPVFNGTITGAVAGDSFTESFTTTATTSSSPGNYPIVPTVAGANLADYTVTVLNGTLTVTATGPAVATTTTTLNAPTNAAFGTAVTLTAMVASAAGTPDGTVTFFSGSSQLGTTTLDGSGKATLSTTALPAGTDSVTAVYSGSGTFASSSSPAVLVTVAAAAGATMTTLTAPASATYGSPLTLTAVVGSASGTPAGTVTFYNGTATLGSGTLDSSGTTTLSTTALPVGSNSVTAAYAAQGIFSSSKSSTVTITIAPGASTAQAGYTLAANPASLTVVLGEAASTTLVVTPVGAYSGSVTLGCVNLPANMTCAFTQSQLTLAGNGQTAQMGLTIKTNGQSARSNLPFAGPGSLLLALVLWFPGRLARYCKRTQRKVHLHLLAATLLIALGLMGCSVSGTAAYAPGTSKVTVFATGTSATAVTTQTAIITVQTTQ